MKRQTDSKGRRVAGVRIETAFAHQLASEWIDSWNSHDLERILAHYEDDFEMSSPVIPIFVGELSGTLRGKAAVRWYWQKALESRPDLHFELLTVLVGVQSATVYYKGHRGLSAEVLHLGPKGKVRAAFAHYATPPE